MDPVGRYEELARGLLGTGYDDLSPVQKSVVDLMANEAPTGESPALAVTDDRSAWDRLSDRIAAVGGSWTFICGFGWVLAAWIGLNLALATRHWAFRPLSLHLPEPGAFDAGRPAGAGDHDEPEPPGRARPPRGRARLPRQSSRRAGDYAPT